MRRSSAPRRRIGAKVSVIADIEERRDMAPPPADRVPGKDDDTEQPTEQA
jgi:hypothetical protein